MPELPEVETTRRGIEPHLAGKRLLSVQVREPRLRWPVSLPPALVGQRLQRVSRRGKYLLFEFQSGTLLVHLGMSGSLRILHPGAPCLKHDHVLFEFESGRSLRFHDPRRFGSVHWQPGASGPHWLLASLGVEPLEPAFDGAYLKARARGRRLAVKNFIMDSRVVVGVGNIYANEALFLAGIRPTVAAGRLSRPAFEALAGRIRQVLQAAIEQGGTTLRDFVNQDGNPGYFAQSLNVYDRAGAPCRRCGSALKGIRQAGRATVFCPNCQKAQGFRRA